MEDKEWLRVLFQLQVGKSSGEEDGQKTSLCGRGRILSVITFSPARTRNFLRAVLSRPTKH